jgi:hypothetical protein
LRRVLRREAHFETIKTLLDLGGCARLQLEGEQNVCAAPFDLRVLKSASLQTTRERARVSSVRLRDAHEEATAALIRRVVVQLGIRSQRDACAFRRVARAERRDAARARVGRRRCPGGLGHSRFSLRLVREFRDFLRARERRQHGEERETGETR